MTCFKPKSRRDSSRIIACIILLACSQSLLFLKMELFSSLTPVAKKSSLLNIEQMQPHERAVAFSILGAQKSGTTALSKYLEQHPSVAGGKFAFFTWYAGRILQQNGTNATRAAMVDFFHADSLKQNGSLLSFDNTPENLLLGNRVAPLMLQAAPRTKLILVVRNPIDRAFSDYSMEMGRRGYVRNMTFERYVDEDLTRLRKAKVLPMRVGAQYNSTIEDQAWELYLRSRMRGNLCPVGRGLYAIQLRQWMDVFGGALDDRRFFIREYEGFYKDGAQHAFDQVTDFIGLRKHNLTDSNPARVGKYKETMKPVTRVMLQEIFTPYNERLVELLGGEWENVWQ